MYQRRAHQATMMEQHWASIIGLWHWISVAVTSFILTMDLSCEDIKDLLAIVICPEKQNGFQNLYFLNIYLFLIQILHFPKCVAF